MISYKIENKIAFSDLSTIHYTGAQEVYMKRFFDNRIFSDFAKEVIFEEAEKALREPHDDDTVVGMWSGEFWGKLVLSACRVYEYTHDEALLTFLKGSVDRILSYAREDGYINSYKDSANVFAPDIGESYKLMGWPCDWNWNIWCRKYTLWGLVEFAKLTGDKDALSGAHRLAKQLIGELKQKDIRLGDTGTANFAGVPSGSIIKPMLVLYRMTEDKEILDFCVDTAEDWDREDGKKPNIIRNALDKKPIHEWYPKSHLWAKAYETMSCLDGLLELYRVTGTEKYLQAVENMYELLMANERNVMGSVGYNDIFAHASAWENAISEPCDVIHLMRVCTELFALTGKSKYMETVDEAFCNAFFAGISDDGKWGARGVRSSGRHFIAEGQSGCSHNHCCVDNVPRGYLNVVSSSVMVAKDAVYVNTYYPFVSDLGDLKLVCGGDYLTRGKVTLVATAKKPVTLMLRVPFSAGKNASVLADGVGFPMTAGGYMCVEISDGVTEFAFDFDFYASVNEFPLPVEEYPANDFRTDRWVWENVEADHMPTDCMMKEPCAYVTYGPLVLAHSKKIGSKESEMFGFETIHGKGYSAEVTPIAPQNDEVVFAKFEVTLKNDDSVRKTVMCDYASASAVIEDRDIKYFNLYI